MNFDCLAHIFDLLSIEDVVNINNTSMNLQFDTRIYYAKRHGFKKVIFDIASDSEWLTPSIKINHFSNQIEVSGIKNTFKFIRSFGSSFKRFTIYYGENERTNNRVNQYFNTFASTTLECFDCIYGSILCNRILQPYVNVTNASFSGVNFQNDLSILALNCPNLRSLKLSCFSMNTSNIKFTHLEELDIWVECRYNSNLIKIMLFLIENPHIQTLKIRSNNITVKMVANLLFSNTKLKNLKISNLNSTSISIDDIIFLLKELTQISKLHFESFVLSVNVVECILKYTKNLVMLKFIIGNQKILK